MDSDAKYTTAAPDPVAVEAAAYAVEVTDVKNPHPWIGRILIFAIIFVIVVGTFGAVIGTINTIQLRNQNDTLKDEQACQTVLLKTITQEQKARAAIAADDRAAQKLYAKEIASAKTQNDRKEAYNKFVQQTALNDKKRESYPVPTFTDSACKINTDTARKLGLIPSSSPTSGKSPVKPSVTPGVSPTSVSTPGGSRVSVSATASPKASSVVRTKTVTQPGKTTTVTKPVAVPTPAPSSSQGLIKQLLNPITQPLCGEKPVLGCILNGG